MPNLWHTSALLVLLTASTYTWAEETAATFGSTEEVATAVSVEPVTTATGATRQVQQQGRTQTITTSTPDKFGTIQESLTPAMRSQASYVTSSGGGYVLTSAQSGQQAEQNEKLMIPSWKLFSW